MSDQKQVECPEVMKRILSTIVIIITVPVVSGLFFTVWANASISWRARHAVTNDADRLRPVNTGLLLGTSRRLVSGRPNQYFYNRMDAAAELFNRNIIRRIIVSGDNRFTYYNEPLDMRNALIQRGVPANKIHMDYAGFRTLDSVVRANKIFGQDQIIVISQKFHNERAVFIARKKGIDAQGYNASDVPVNKRLKTRLREIGARNKAMLDVVFGVQPKFLGDPVDISD
jgi:SanA protein